MKAAIIFIVGLLLGGVIIGGAGFYIPRTSSLETVVATAESDLGTDGGIVIPKGTEMIFEEAMDEGFYRLRFSFNIEPEEYKKRFSETKDKRTNLMIPYWIKP